MARVTVEDCLENVDNRFELVMVATKRARQLATGGREPLVKEDSDKATVIALREIADNLLTDEILNGRSIEAESAAIFGEAEEAEAVATEDTDAEPADKADDVVNDAANDIDEENKTPG